MMKLIFPKLPSLFASWATAGQYSSVEELEMADEQIAPARNKVHPLPGRNRASVASKPLRKKLG